MDREVKRVFEDVKGRREGLIKALTTEYEDFYLQCDPEKENLGLYGLPNGKWKVDGEVDAQRTLVTIPDPTTGINFCKELGKETWVSFVAVYSDSWLLAVASYYACRFEKASRKLLFDMINELPTVTEVAIEAWENNNVINNNGSNEPPPVSQSQEETIPPQGQQDANKCGKCSSDKDLREIWICCDTCNKWFHGECVDVTEEQSKLIGDYECPLCSEPKKRERLFDMINELLTVSEVVKEAWGIQEKDKPESSSTNDSSIEPHPSSQEDMIPPQGQQDDDKCEKCSSDKEPGGFRISCDTCKKWFHRECIDVTNEQSKLIKEYECPLCRRRRKGKSHIH